MGNLWLRIKVFMKVTVFAAVLIYLIFFVAENSAKPVKPWFWFKHEPQTTVLKLVLFAFAAGVVCAVLLRTTLATVRQIRQLQERGRTARLDREMADMRNKAAMLRSKPETTATPPGPPPADEAGP